jgi:thiol-disulfide isomerase/thioredoxin
MHLKKNYFGILMLFFCTNTFCQEYFPLEKKIYNRDSIASFLIKAPNGSQTNLHTGSKELLVIAFLSPECPLCKNYSTKLVGIKNKFSKKADFIGIVPGSFESKDVIEFQKNYMPSWQIVRDTSLRLTHYLEGEVTPEVLVIDNKNGSLIYKGAIDNWLVSLGKTRNHVTNYYLDIALTNFINDRSSTQFTKPVGCLINDF